MARKAGKARIASAMDQWHTWRDQIKSRIEALKLEGARQYLWDWVYDVRERIESGDLSVSTSALARSVMREIESWESGYYVGLTESGGRICATC